MLKPRDIFKKLLNWALMRNGCFPLSSRIHDDGYEIMHSKEIPDRLLPGRLVMDLSDEERKVLSELESKDINDRIDGSNFPILCNKKELL